MARPAAPAIRGENGPQHAGWGTLRLATDVESERELTSWRRAPASIVLCAMGRLVVLSGALAGCIALVATGVAPALGVRGAVLTIVATLVVLSWEAVKRDAHRYCLTDQRLMWRFGVLRRVIVEIPLERVQSVVVTRSVLERALGLGSVRVSSAGSESAVVMMRHIARPEQAMEAVHDAVTRYAGARRAARESSMPIAYSSPGPDQTRFMPVIGIVGGIGAGKSTVAQAFQRLGCHVVDSDARAKEALDRPDVRAELVAWWGDEILNRAGRVDRAKVASIIFSDPEQRARLERLVHPIVRQDRAKLIEEAARFWAKGVIVDAPLLFEAGVDKECDVVVFVDAPRETRVARVRATRGWSEEELTRREAQQMPLEEKRARSHYGIMNAGADDIEGQAARVLAQVRAKFG